MRARFAFYRVQWMLLLVTAAFVGVTLWSWRALGRYQPFADITRAARASRVGIQIADAAVSGRSAGRLRWRVSARAIVFSADRREAIAQGIHDGLLYDGRGRAALSVAAGRAVYATPPGVLGVGNAPPEGTLHMDGGIRAAVLRAGGPVLTATALAWDALSGQARCFGTVTARFPGGMASGDELTLDTHTGDLSLQHLRGEMALAALAAGAAPAPAQQYVTYDAGASRWLSAPRTVEMSQGVVFSQDDAHLKTEAALVNLDDQQRALNAKSAGPVHLYDTQNDLTGAQGFVDFTRHLATLTGHIVLTVKPGPREAGGSSARRQFQQPATMTCDALTYDYRRKTGRVPGPLTVRQSIPQKNGILLKRTLTADAADYDSRAQTIVLTGHVHGQDSDGNIIQATTTAGRSITIGLKEGEEYIQVPLPLHGVFPTKNEPDEAAPAPTSEPPAPTHSPSSVPAAAARP